LRLRPSTPPYGAFGPGIMRAAGALGYREVLLWDIDTNDWRGRTPAAITAQVVKEARPGSIALLHTLPQSAAALPDVIRGLRARGLETVGIGELIASGRPVGGPW
jgi:peptidoglycan-N-acetylglucosamine deacetylase